jgi:hypothetical protein
MQTYKVLFQTRKFPKRDLARDVHVPSHPSIDRQDSKNHVRVVSLDSRLPVTIMEK